MRKVIFPNSGTLFYREFFGTILKTREVEGEVEIPLSRRNEYYLFEGARFFLLKGEGALQLDECVHAPKHKNIAPYFVHTKDKKGSLLPCPNFQKHLDTYLLSKNELFDTQEVKGFITFLKTMDSNTKSKCKKFEIAECECLNRYLANKVRSHKAKREEAR